MVMRGGWQWGFVAALLLGLCQPLDAKETTLSPDLQNYKIETIDGQIKTIQDNQKALKETVNGLNSKQIELKDGVERDGAIINEMRGRFDDIHFVITTWMTIISLFIAIMSAVGYFHMRDVEKSNKEDAKNIATNEARSSAENTAKVWIDNNTVLLTNEIENLRKKVFDFTKQADDASKEIDEKTEKVRDGANLFKEQMARGLESVNNISYSDKAKLDKVSAYEERNLSGKPESKYTPDDWKKRAFAAYYQNDFETALFYFIKQINHRDTKNIDLAWALYNKGVTLGQLKRRDVAITAYNDLIARYGDSTELALQEQVAWALYNKGWSLGQLKRKDDAITVYNEVIARYGDSTELALQEPVAKALVNKGVALGRLNRSEEEITAYDDLIARYGASTELALQEQVANALNNRADSFIKLGRHDEAHTDCDKVLELLGASTEARFQVYIALAIFNKGESFFVQKQYLQAIPFFDKVNQRFNQSTDEQVLKCVAAALVFKGSALIDLNHKDEAKPCFDEVIQRFADSKNEDIIEQVAKARDALAKLATDGDPPPRSS